MVKGDIFLDYLQIRNAKIKSAHEVDEDKGDDKKTVRKDDEDRF